MPKFSIVIAVYNKGNFIKKTLKSVLHQSVQDYEIIIVNDGSTDISEEEILKFKDQRIQYFKQSNQGAGATRNRAIQLASGDYIALLDADDLWEPNYLQEQLKRIQRYPNESVFSCAIYTKKGNKKFIKPYSIPSQEEGIYNYFTSSLKTSILHSSSTILKKNVFEKVGYYDPTIKSGQDTDLYVRIGLQYPIVFNPSPLVIYTINEGSLWRSIKSIKDRAHFEQYKTEEAQNPDLKKFIDINRFSLAIQAKQWNEVSHFKKLRDQIDLKNLNKKQRFLLRQPRFILSLFFKLKRSMEKAGLSFTIFG